jgi:hypothetical protein
MEENKHVDDISVEDENTVDVIPPFDFGSINKDHQSAAKEIADWLNSLGLDDISKELLSRFKINPIPTYNLEESEFYKLAKNAGIFEASQGNLVEGSGKEAMQYPLVAISGDIRQMDKFIEVIKKSK